MPFQSEKQRRLLWSQHPEVAKRWAHKYGTPKNLPMYKHRKKRKSESDRIHELTR
jgi:hypothetical protein